MLSKFKRKKSQGFKFFGDRSVYKPSKKINFQYPSCTSVVNFVIFHCCQYEVKYDSLESRSPRFCEQNGGLVVNSVVTELRCVIVQFKAF